MLCQKCTALVQTLVKDDRETTIKFVNHYADTPAENLQRPGGCDMCIFLLPSTIKTPKEMVKYAKKDHELIITRTIERLPHLCYSIKVVFVLSDPVTWSSSSFMIMPSSTIPIDFSIRDRPSDFDLESAIPAARHWIHGCLRGHEKCPKNTRPQSYPTRLLELHDSSMRLVLPAEMNLSDPYAALSYCWGENPSFLCLSASNFHEFQKGKPYSILPVAFQEAIRLIKKLGIHYIWIDALCIIQAGPGSKEDWQSECVNMQQVYSNCEVNLSLSTASCPDESCLDGRRPSKTPPFEIQIPSRNDSNRHETWTIVSPKYYEEALYDQPLGTRAWALQERLLSPRVVSLGRGELFWDCIQMPNASETLPCGGIVNTTDERQFLEKSIPDTSDREKLESVWWNIVKEYTERKLTFPHKDKFMAFSAVAAQMAHAMDDVYIAGHFWKTIPYSLNWQAGHEDEVETTPQRIVVPAGDDGCEKDSHTPSWSWASMNGALIVNPFSAPESEIVAEAESYELSLLEENHPYGPVSYANLKITAFCAEIEWRKTQLKGRSVLRGDDPNEMPDEGAGVLLAALIHFPTKEEYWDGIILRERERNGHKQYTRIGHFTFQPDEEHSFASFFESEKRTLTLV
ncbi:hypothetical protein ASPWEDRAFT_38689 [Aspergillus wentii DTO 134E9]|uniref:Heterokaryon incompatibility domain-containing protein n=1 Tax=Aspergillus wentii DTO 134E9 TaxID=1073089 RepID=A0A1L9RQF5_ASPWE|nr:uncharacterized protein ASPWEDRAFT_38689 [Aspergillus wentii DTO 134E9]KAI9928460.1 hypothetical protein MW887_002505 [Aspergillus wentii]OJJ37048.1 hypothetical protein ASPWEDRAFT_38689 [Aspergillus wentii DTO 134E9]